MQFLAENAATIIVSAVLITLLGLAIRSMVKSRKKASGCCNGACAGCPYSKSCH
ncbi:MAG: FeoB-associated Cys-rich membrane protein [Clostridiales bacterium]|nr:FeoB-associated Cys-rich membrane protein [Clostridiales bacterium]